MTNLAKFSIFSSDASAQLIPESDEIQKLKQELKELKKSTDDYVEIHTQTLRFKEKIEEQITSLTNEKLALQSQPALTPKQSNRLASLQVAIETQQLNVDRLNEQIESSEANRLIAERMQAIEALKEQIESLSTRLNTPTPVLNTRKFF